MFPPQTSLIPVTVALARFIESHGFVGDYPFWYLGVPVRFLAGPIVPGFLVGLHKLLPAFSFFDLSYALIFVSFIVGAFGWGLLTWRLSKNKKMGLVAGILFLILPWKWLSALALSETSAVVVANLLPFGLVILVSYLVHRSFQRLILAVVGISILLLVNTGIIPTLVVGMVALSLTISYEENQFKNLSKYLKRPLFVSVLSLLIVTVWYTPVFWWALLVNPSLGGKTGFQVIWRIFDLFKVFIPLILAVSAVFFWRKIKSELGVFAFIWVLTFVFLTAFRFLSNPAFWQDFSSWFLELEIGLGLILAKILTDRLNRSTKIYIVILSSFLLPYLITSLIYWKLGQPVFVSSSKPVITKSLEELNRIAGVQPERIFLSGSTVFWANSLYDLYQVRGGRDEASINPGWLKASYEIREGSDPQKTITSLKKLGVTYVLVHGADSLEYYHDFKNLEKWDQIGRKIWESEGNMIYQIDY